MDANERITALKKVYADIILNTAKEAAARIMVSERKAVRFQHELFVAKEEALQMLLRLKNMMDSKMSEAASVSFSQQKKIEELEAQLQEAEDIVNELRGELIEVQGQLERVTKNKEQSFASLNDISRSIQNDPLESHQFGSMTSAAMNTSNWNEENKRCNASYVGNLELPSIILRSKESELYRNGCTQRILAFERNADRDLSLSRKPKSSDVGKPHVSIREDKEVERICAPSMYEGGDKSNIEEKREETELPRWQQVRPVKSLGRSRKSASRTRKQRTPSQSYQCDQVTKMDQTSYTSCTEKDAILGKNAEDPSQMVQRVSVEFEDKNKSDGKNEINNGETKDVSMENLGATVCKVDDEKVDVALDKLKVEVSDKSNGVPSQPDRIIQYQRKRKRGSLNTSNGNGTLENGATKNGNGTMEKEAIKNGNGTIEEGTMKNGNGTLEKEDMKNGNGNGTPENGTMKNKNEDGTLEEGAMKNGNITPERGAKKNGNGTTEKRAKKKGKGTNGKGAKKTGNGTNEKEAKENGNGPTEKAAKKRKTEKLLSSLETKRSSLLPEPPRDSSRLAQVARQLLSLAEKKW